MAVAAKAYEAQLKVAGPKTDDELHDWIKDNVGIDIPRGSVCTHTNPPHIAPFQFLADLYFERTGSALAMANRGGSKTFIVALLHYLNSLFKPGCESCTFGAVENQSDRAYSHLKTWVYDKEGNKKPEIVDSKMKATEFKNGSIVYVLGSTPEQVNGPHPQKAHADEVELMRPDTWSESRNMAVSKRLVDGTLIKPQDILTSTRKGPRGRMQDLIDQIEESLRKDLIPPYELYVWCIFECASPVSNCREAPENAGRPDEELCICHKYKKGFWDDESDRYLNQVCGGKLYNSKGWKPYEDITNTFMQNGRAVWEAQQECSKPSEENRIIPQFSSVQNGIRYFLPVPKNGPIYMGVDWGGTAANSVHWYQMTTRPIIVMNHRLEEIEIPIYSLICFDEIYEENTPPSKLGNKVHQVESFWRGRVPDFSVDDRFPDPQGRGARNEWSQMENPLITHFRATRDFETHVTYLHDWLDDSRFYVDETRCPMFIAEAEAWKRNPLTGKEVREFNHAMSDFRYCVANIEVLNAKMLKQRKNVTTRPVSHSKYIHSSSGQGSLPVSVRQNTESESWRGRFATAQPDLTYNR